MVGELYRNLARSRRAVALLERSALDWPELADVWFGEIRRETIEKLTRYLERRVRQNLLRDVPQVEVAARLLLETVAWAALHRHGDPEPPRADEAAIENSAVDFIVQALIRRKR